MQRIGIVNIFIGFFVIVLASCVGVFVVTEAEKALIFDQKLMASWQYTLLKSAHGHFNLFGMLHILMGLSFPYSKLSPRYFPYQTMGLSLGTMTMGGLLLVRSVAGIPQGADYLGWLIGACLMLSLISLMLHCYGIAWKCFRYF